MSPESSEPDHEGYAIQPPPRLRAGQGEDPNLGHLQAACILTFLPDEEPTWEEMRGSWGRFGAEGTQSGEMMGEGGLPTWSGLPVNPGSLP